ncbi:MAG: hypothetical protein J6R99_01495 [Alphaproteobacteria bacterium]|nr:hypothetical protein [Alphaproteobacteria bacterium]
MNTARIVKLLENSGFYNVRSTGDFIYMEDPSCALRDFDNFFNYAWIAILCITGFLLLGWGISKMRGAKDDVFSNMKNLLMVFAVLAVLKPVLNLIYGGNLFSRGCGEISVSVEEVNKVLESRDETLGTSDGFLYEDLKIYDSGVPEQADYADEIQAEMVN